MKEIIDIRGRFKPCPHCGRQAKVGICGKIEYLDDSFDTSWLRIKCESCGTTMEVWTEKADPTEDELIEAGLEKWNARSGVVLSRPTIYISGAITGDPNYKAKFAAVETKLSEMGFEPINPARTDLGPEATYKDYLDHGLTQLMQADMACRIGPAMGSDGLSVEMFYAEEAGIPIMNAIWNAEEGTVRLGSNNELRK